MIKIGKIQIKLKQERLLTLIILVKIIFRHQKNEYPQKNNQPVFQLKIRGAIEPMSLIHWNTDLFKREINNVQ